jgi:glyoxylase-like metal-dependent hydrolase (beta-lactamase superfamily II)
MKSYVNPNGTVIHRVINVMSRSYILESPEGLFLVDAGMWGGGSLLLRCVQSLGHSLEDVKLLLLTHGHLDHFGGAAKLRERIPSLPVFIHPDHAAAVCSSEVLISPGDKLEGKIYESIAGPTHRINTLSRSTRYVPNRRRYAFRRFRFSGDSAIHPGTQ